jgi:hypothetical protein
MLTLMMEEETVSETLVFNSTLTLLITQEFIALIRRESFKHLHEILYHRLH